MVKRIRVCVVKSDVRCNSFSISFKLFEILHMAISLSAPVLSESYWL